MWLALYFYWTLCYLFQKDSETHGATKSERTEEENQVLEVRELTVNLEANPISVEPNPMITRALFLHEFDFGDDYCYGCCTTEADSVNICEVDISQLA